MVPVNAMNLVGQRFGRLVVVDLSPQRDRSGKRLWVCVCDCGKTMRGRTQLLNAGRVRSCGCGRKPPPIQKPRAPVATENSEAVRALQGAWFGHQASHQGTAL